MLSLRGFMEQDLRVRQRLMGYTVHALRYWRTTGWTVFAALQDCSGTPCCDSNDRTQVKLSAAA